ncbi:hypothetical protein V1264_021813 [Littorina saxatilis]|uniref:Uncharacterized protein n=2 Tax=Littorina saxatilis TaxID=31220 RepID=A0AAN9AJ88_9CAEN
MVHRSSEFTVWRIDWSWPSGMPFSRENTCHNQFEDLLLGLCYFCHNRPLSRANLKKSYLVLGNEMGGLQNTCHRQLDDLLLGLCYFCHNSPLSRANLKKSYPQLLDVKPIMPDGWAMSALPSTTSWKAMLPLFNIFNGSSLLMPRGARPEQQAKSRKFYKVATSFEVVQYACCLLDVLQQLNHLSLTLQRKTITIAEVLKSLQVTRAVLQKYEDRDGPKLQKLNQKLELEAVPLMNTGNSTSFQASRHLMKSGNSTSFQASRHLMKSGNSTSFKASRHLTKIGNSTSFQASCRKLVEGLLASLDRRLDDVDTGVLLSSILAAFSSWPHKDSSKDFGNDCLDDLTVHFKAVLESA